MVYAGSSVRNLADALGHREALTPAVKVATVMGGAFLLLAVVMVHRYMRQAMRQLEGNGAEDSDTAMGEQRRDGFIQLNGVDVLTASHQDDSGAAEREEGLLGGQEFEHDIV